MACMKHRALGNGASAVGWIFGVASYHLAIQNMYGGISGALHAVWRGSCRFHSHNVRGRVLAHGNFVSSCGNQGQLKN